ncbi:MAG: hypothetical protein FWG28_01690 [Clostridiales bacterium]|nr:hypothetical protein [Clostridiales bacterium]
MDIPKGLSLADYQLAMLNAQLIFTAERSRFYREKLAGVDLPLKALADLQRLPFTTARDIAGRGADMVCGGAGTVDRIVTIHSTGTGGAPKRLFFSGGDLKRTVDFFAVGMRYMCNAADSVMVFMPTDSENGVGQLLVKGLVELGAFPVAYGLISDFGDAAAALRQREYHTVIGLPSQIRKLALLAPDIRPANVLLSADYVSDAARETISRIWGCEVFAHYGLTETGYGCAVECPAHDGQHIRCDELLIEIVEPEWADPTPEETVTAATGLVKPEGGWGEIVITTLRREAMPLIRYRTGDLGRLIWGRCACGSELPRLDKVLGRLRELQHDVNIYRMDELLLNRDEILDYRAVVAGGRLTVTIEAAAAAIASISATASTAPIAETAEVADTASIAPAAPTAAIADTTSIAPATIADWESVLRGAWLESDITVRLAGCPPATAESAKARPPGWTVKRGVERIGKAPVL